MNPERTFALIVRLLALLCAMTGVIAIAIVVMALRSLPSQTVEARKFVLRDSIGRVRAEMSVDNPFRSINKTILIMIPLKDAQNGWRSGYSTHG